MLSADINERTVDLNMMLIISVIFLALTRAGGLGQFISYPIVGIQAEGTQALFHCAYNNQSHSIVWIVNGTSLIHLSQPHITSSTDGSSLTLSILAIPEYNGTVAHCLVYPSRMVSDSVTLLVQGPLAAVQNLAFSEKPTTLMSITITWDAPFSLDLTTAEPDIQYCVDVYNVTGGGDDLVEFECDTMTFYVFTPVNPNTEHLFSFEVTPRSNVPGAINGTTSDPVQGYLFSQPSPIPTEVISYSTNAILSPITWQFPVEVIGVIPGHMPTEYFIRLHSIDDQDDPSQCSCRATSETVNDMIVLTLQLCLDCNIQLHRVYSYTISTINGAGTSSSEPANLTTHDVQDFRVTKRIYDQYNYSDIEITFSYLSGSSPTGFFGIVSSLTNWSDVHYVVADRDGQTDTRIVINNLSHDNYRVIAYDRGDDYLPERWSAESEITHSVNADSQSGPSIVPSETKSVLQPPPALIFPKDDLLCLNCSFSNMLVNACVAIVHSTYNTTGLLGKQLKVYSVNSSIMYDCFQVEEEDYRIAVFGLLRDGLERVPAVKTIVRRRDMFTTISATPHEMTVNVSTVNVTIIIAGTVPALTVLALGMVIILCVTITVFKHRKKKTRSLNVSGNLNVTGEMVFPGIEQPNEAYNFVKTFHQNEAYNMFHITATRAQPERLSHTPLPIAAKHRSPDHIYDEPLPLVPPMVVSSLRGSANHPTEEATNDQSREQITLTPGLTTMV